MLRGRYMPPCQAAVQRFLRFTERRKMPRNGIKIRKKHKKMENCGEVTLSEAGFFVTFFFVFSFAAGKTDLMNGRE